MRLERGSTVANDGVLLSQDLMNPQSLSIDLSARCTRTLSGGGYSIFVRVEQWKIYVYSFLQVLLEMMKLQVSFNN